MVESANWPKEDGKIAIAVLGSAGDLKQIWDRSNPAEVWSGRDYQIREFVPYYQLGRFIRETYVGKLKGEVR